MKTKRRWVFPTYNTEIVYNGRTIQARTFSARDLERLLDLCRAHGPEIAAEQMSKSGPRVSPRLARYFAKEAGLSVPIGPASF